MKTKLSIIPLLALLLIACSISQISISLTVVSDSCTAATIAIPVLEATGIIDVPMGNTILTYTAAVGDAAAKSSIEIQSTDTPKAQATKIIAYFESIVTPAIGSASPEVQAIVKAIESAVNLFLSHFTGPVAKKLIASGAADHIKLSFGDRHHLGALASKLSKTAARARGLIK